jgi:hypothetical protein
MWARSWWELARRAHAEFRLSPAAERRLFSLGLMMATLMLGALSLPMWLGQVYPKDDLGIAHLSMRFFYAGSLARGDSFLWWPEVFCGYYLHGEGQAGMYHPLHLLLYRTLPLATAFNLELLLNYPFLLAGTFLFLRSWRIPFHGAILGALLFTFSSFNLLHIVHPNIVAVIAHAPWLLVAIDRVLSDSDPRRVAFAKLGVAALTASQLLLGHPQAVWLSSALELLYVVFRTPDWQSPGRIWSLGIAKGLGVLGGGIQLLPTWDVVMDSVRADSGFMSAYRYKGSLPPANVVQFVAPYLTKARVFGGEYTQEFSLYCGALSPVLMVWLGMRRRGLGPMQRLARGAFFLGTLAFVLSLGQYGYLYRLQAYVPLLRWLGAAARYISLLQFAIAVGAAIAFVDITRLAERRAPLEWRRLWPLGFLPVGSLLVAVGSLWLRARPELFPDYATELASPAYAFLGPILVIAATALVVAAARGVRYSFAGIILFAVLDPGVYGLSELRRPFPPVPLTSLVEGQAAPPPAAPHRVQSDNNFLTMRGVRLAGGYVAFRPRRYLDDLQGKRLQLAGVRWVQTKTPWARAEETAPLPAELASEVRISYDSLGRPSSWSGTSAPAPRARLVTKELVSSALKEDLDAVDVESTVLVLESLRLRGERPGTVSIVSDRPGEIRLRTSATSPQLLVLSESWHEGWRATLDGEPRPVVRAYGDFLGSIVEAGQHEVEFRFRPTSFRMGAWLSAISLCLMFLYVVPHPRGAKGPGPGP